MWACVPICECVSVDVCDVMRACADGHKKSTSGVISQVPFTLFLESGVLNGQELID